MLGGKGEREERILKEQKYRKNDFLAQTLNVDHMFMQLVLSYTANSTNPGLSSTKYIRGQTFLTVVQSL